MIGSGLAALFSLIGPITQVSILVVLDDWFGQWDGCSNWHFDIVSILVVLDDWFGLGDTVENPNGDCMFQSLLFWMIGSGSFRAVSVGLAFAWG